MEKYYEVVDGRIGRWTENRKIAEELGFDHDTELDIVTGCDGRNYIAGTEPARPACVGDYDAAMEAHLRSEQTDRGYTTRSPAEYAMSANERWAQDARDWVAHVTEVMEYALDIENRVAAGGEAPSIEEFVAGIPRIVWTYRDEAEGAES